MTLSIYWQIANESAALSGYPSLNVSGADTVTTDPLWPLGYKVVDQDIPDADVATLDSLANNHILINFYPSPRPPFSPTGR